MVQHGASFGWLWDVKSHTQIERLHQTVSDRMEGPATSVHHQERTEATSRHHCWWPSFCRWRICSDNPDCDLWWGREAHWGAQELQRAEQIQESMFEYEPWFKWAKKVVQDLCGKNSRWFQRLQLFFQKQQPERTVWKAVWKAIEQVWSVLPNTASWQRPYSTSTGSPPLLDTDHHTKTSLLHRADSVPVWNVDSSTTTKPLNWKWIKCPLKPYHCKRSVQFYCRAQACSVGRLHIW